MQKDRGKEFTWYSLKRSEVVQKLNSSKDDGLSSSEVSKRLNDYGSNSFIREDKYRLLKIFFANFKNFLIYVLFAAALISLFAKEKLEFYIILFIIIITIVLSFIQEFSADRTVKALNNLRPKDVTVIRNSKKISIMPENLVPGDIVLLNRGDLIPADMRILECNGISADEAILTGESVSKPKSEKVLEKSGVAISSTTNILYASTSITSGSGKGIVYATGFDTEIGKLSENIQQIKTTKSPLQKKIDAMSKRISLIVIVVCIMMFITMLSSGVSVSLALLIVSAVAVAGIPESFPLAMTLSLSRGVKKMAQKNALLKNLNSVETLGNTTVICTDKTGTLTENKMKISKLFFGLKETLDVQGVAYVPDYKIFKNSKTISSKDLNDNFFISSILCNNSSLYKENEQWKLEGEPTEGAFISLAQSQGYDEVKLRDEYKKIHEEPFTPEKKYMITVHRDKSKKSSLVSMKGAAERVLMRCAHYRDERGKIYSFSKTDKKHFLDLIEKQTSDGFRVMAVASKHLTQSTNDKLNSHFENGFTLEAIVGIEDPIREQVFSAVEECMNAGIKIVMVTGDHKLTALSIAKKLKIITSDKDIALTGEELAEIDDEHLDQIIENVRVFSRVTPEDKLRIISSFQRKGQIVAMTGDGVNDAPALKKADIGVSMGKNGTEVAREASDMILLDDNFATIVAAVKEGRTIYSNLRRFVYYLLTTNFAQVGIIFLAILLGFVYTLPLTAIMILFINLVTSTFPALALSVEPTHDKVMTYKPRDPKERILSKYILTKILVIFPIMMFSAFTLYLWELQILNSGVNKAMTVTFLVMVFSGLFHTFNARRLHTTIFNKDFFGNIYVFISVAFSAFLTILAIGTSYGRELFGLTQVGVYDWFIVLLFSSFIVVFAEILKFSISNEFEEQANLRGIKNYLK